jgi:hypothetical protein
MVSFAALMCCQPLSPAPWRGRIGQSLGAPSCSSTFDRQGLKGAGLDFACRLAALDDLVKLGGKTVTLRPAPDEGRMPNSSTSPVLVLSKDHSHALTVFQGLPPAPGLSVTSLAP